MNWSVMNLSTYEKQPITNARRIAAGEKPLVYFLCGSWKVKEWRQDPDQALMGRTIFETSGAIEMAGWLNQHEMVLAQAGQ